LVARSKGTLRGLDAATGREIFHTECDGFARAANGDDLFVASRGMLSRIDSSNGERRWQRRMRSSAPLWPVAGGVVRPTEEGIVYVSDLGAVAFETRVPGGRPELCAEGEGTVLLAGKEHLLALDAERGKPSSGFGDDGLVDLKASVRGDMDGGFSLASPPTVYRNIVIT
ncbi:MAG: PQQ-binding-like beta-propeller repeat protein, partial [Chthoniobacterales bacterium]